MNNDVNKKISSIISSYTELKKIYIEDTKKINMLLKEKLSKNKCHLYTYNDEIKFIIRAINFNKNNKIVNIYIYLLSNNKNAIQNAYISLNSKNKINVKELSYMYYHENESILDYVFDTRVGIIKYLGKCINNKNITLFDIEALAKISKLDLKNDYYYLGNNKYIDKNKYQEWANSCINEIKNGLYVKLSHHGSYDTIYKTYNKLLRTIKKENKKIIGLPIEQFIYGRWNDIEESEYITNILIPIEN